MSSQTSSGSRIEKVAILGGHVGGKGENYRQAAAKLGKTIAAKGLSVVCSGATTGLLGVVAQAAHEVGGKVFSVVLTSPEDIERIDAMHKRKREVACLADCFIMLPGGLEALEEFMEIVSWSQLGIHDNPIGLLNVDGFFDLLLRQIDDGIDKGFIKPSQRKLFVVADDINQLLQELEKYDPIREGALPKGNWEKDAAPSTSAGKD